MGVSRDWNDLEAEESETDEIAGISPSIVNGKFDTSILRRADLADAEAIQVVLRRSLVAYIALGAL